MRSSQAAALVFRLGGFFEASEADLASLYPCPGGGEGCPREAICHSPNHFVAVRRDELQLCDRLDLPIVNLFQRQGDYWQVQYAGQAASIRHRAGIETLALLLREEGRSWAPEHIAMEVEGASPEGQTEDLILDEIAIQDIRQQIHALDKGIQKAENSGQEGQARGFRDEQAALHQYLKADQRHDGRSRSFQDSAQRLRNPLG